MDLRLELDDRSQTPLFRQVYEQLRELILSGALPAGTRLPASRKLAKEHQVARVTISAAIEQLAAEGYVISRVGAGTFVAEAVPIPAAASGEARGFRPALSDWGRRVLSVGNDERIPAHGGNPDQWQMAQAGPIGSVKKTARRLHEAVA